MPIFLILNVGIIKNVPRRISMILQIWMMIIYMKILTLKLVDVLKHNLVEEIKNLQDVVVSNALLLFLIPVVLNCNFLTYRGRTRIYTSYASSTTLWLWTSLFDGRQWCHDRRRNLRRGTWWHQVTSIDFFRVNTRAATLQDWLLHPPVRRTIAREFRTFLLEYTNEIGESVYGARINNLGERNLESLEVDYSHLRNTRATVAKFLAQCPTEVLKVYLLHEFQLIIDLWYDGITSHSS